MVRVLVRRVLRRGILFAVLLLAALMGLRIYDTSQGPPLQIWHTTVPEDLHADAIDAMNWTGYLAAEAALFARVRTEVTDQLEPEDRTPANRYFTGSPIYPGHFAQDWNRSYMLLPEGEPVGAVVLLHGLTDAPYSLRHIARLYRDRGYVAIGIRLPAHGTVPGALTDVVWEDWLAATRLAVREARARAGGDRPLHIVGFSNGGALAMKYALDALGDPGLARPDQLILISPMVGITAFARFAGLAALPALLPSFARTAWLGILPEFNPFKYNSFPVNGARQSYRLTSALQQEIQARRRSGDLARLPPVLTFQSVVDFTVSTRAILRALYAQLPANGSEIVLFDINRNSKFGPLLGPASETALERLMPPGAQAFRSTVITNAGPGRDEVVEQVTEAGEGAARTSALPFTYPRGFFSLSHVALPFPPGDALYGADPDGTEDFGVNLGAIAGRGERGVMIVSMDALARASSNPFFPYVADRIVALIPPRTTP